MSAAICMLSTELHWGHETSMSMCAVCMNNVRYDLIKHMQRNLESKFEFIVACPLNFS